MAEFAMSVTGLPEVSEMFKQLSGPVLERAIAKGLAAGAVPIVREIVTLCPERELSNRDENVDPLVDHIQTQIELYPNGGRAVIGFGKQGWKALLIEYGHRMIGHLPEKRQLHGPKTPDGMVKSIPFMREGLDAATDEAINGFIRGFESEFTK